MDAVPTAVPGAFPGAESAPVASRVYRLLRPREVSQRTTLSRSHINRLINGRQFPGFDAVADRACGLPEHVLDAFLAERMAARDSMPPFGFRAPLPEWHFDWSKVPPHVGIRLLRRREVEALTGTPKSTFYPLIPKGRFPMQVPLGVQAARWVAHEVAAWVVAPAAFVSAVLVSEPADPLERRFPQVAGDV